MRKPYFIESIGDRELLEETAKSIAAQWPHSLPTTKGLCGVTEAHGINIATLVINQCLRNHPVHGAFISEVESSASTPQHIKNPPILFIVPGLYHLERPELGSDARLICDIAARFGIRASVVPMQSRGSISNNAKILHNHLTEHASGEYWVASISLGGAAFKWLLNDRASAPYLSHLQGWVNMNGIVRGTPLIKTAAQSAVSRQIFRMLASINRLHPDLVDELHHSHCNWSKTVIRPEVTYLNLLSLPMSWDVTAPVQNRYKKLSQLGPTDGTVMLLDYLKEPSLCYPIVGVDHLTRSSNLSRVFYQLMNRLFVDKIIIPRMSI